MLINAMRALTEMIFCLRIVANISNVHARRSGVGLRKFRYNFAGKHNGFLPFEAFLFFINHSVVVVI